MRNLRRECRTLLVYLATLTLYSVAASACDHLPAGESIWVRLTAPVSSFDAKIGDQVQAVVTQDVTCDGQTVFPLGAHVYGTVELVHKVGWGVRHETASLKLAFHQVGPSRQGMIDIGAEIASIDNAREPISNGLIRGIRSTNTPQGTLTTRLMYLPGLNPYPSVGLLLFKATFPIFPEPEIYLPAGTDMQLTLSQPVVAPAVSAELESQSEPPPDPDAVRELVAELPERSTTAPDMVTADVINVALVGSREQVQTAFMHAGWQNADPINRHSILRIMHAVLAQSSYPRAPMRPFLVEGNVPDMNWQKSFDTYAQRDHMRVWQWTGSTSDETVWLGTATHDRSGGFCFKRHQFVHRIDPEIDAERSKIIRDLRAAGCVRSVSVVPREQLASVIENATGDALHTDGAIAVIELQDCHAAVPELATDSRAPDYKAGNALFRYLRRDILTVRSDLWRANIIYATYGILRAGFVSWKHHEAVALAGNAARHKDAQAAATLRAAQGGGTTHSVASALPEPRPAP